MMSLVYETKLSRKVERDGLHFTFLLGGNRQFSGIPQIYVKNQE